MTTRPQFSGCRYCIAKIGYGCKSAIAMQCQPGAPGLLVATAQYVRYVGPPVRVLRWSCVKLVAIAGDDQRVIGADPVRDDDQADSLDSGILDPVIDQSPRD